MQTKIAKAGTRKSRFGQPLRMKNPNFHSYSYEKVSGDFLPSACGHFLLWTK
jgi:hypothetical protein